MSQVWNATMAEEPAEPHIVRRIGLTAVDPGDGTLDGMQSFDAHLAQLWAADQLSEATALHRARDPQSLRDRYRLLGTSGRR